MGFSTAVLSSAAILPGLMQAGVLRQQSKQLYRTADAQAALDAAQARSMTDVAIENQRRALRNAEAELGQARADAGASQLASEGSVVVREQDLATRLQDSIAQATNEQLQQVNYLQQQSAFNTWNLRNSAKRAQYGALSSLVSGVAQGLHTYATLDGKAATGEKQR